MGGKGSGTWSRGSKKLTLEDVWRIDVRRLQKDGVLEAGYSGTLSWRTGGGQDAEIKLSTMIGCVRLNYHYRASQGERGPVTQVINLDYSPCHFGGSRVWFFCPGCDRRVAILARVGKLFLCRHCCGLPYASSNENKIEREIRKLHKLGDRIFEGRAFNRRKGMHHRTYDKLAYRFFELECDIEHEVISLLGKDLV